LVALGALVQAISHIGLILVAAFSVQSFWLLLGLIAVYYVAGMAIVPAWGAWMGALTEHRNRERYFATRSTCVSVSMLSAFLWAGYRLQTGAAMHDVSHVFAWLFGVGLVARLGSSAMLMRQPDPLPVRRDTMRRVLARTRSAVKGDAFKLAIVLGVWLLGANISIPFYAPYMLKTLGVGYDGYALLCGAQLVAKAIAFPFTYRVAARVGLPKMLITSMAGAALVALMWGTERTVAGLLLAQVISGVAWAGYEFASFQLLLGSARPSQRVEFLAMSASLGGVMQLSGALAGSWLLAHAHFGYRDIFVTSGFLRALPLLGFVPLLAARRQPLAAPAQTSRT
jgi:MFS family permease